MPELTDGQTENGNFIGPPVGRGAKKLDRNITIIHILGPITAYTKMIYSLT